MKQKKTSKLAVWSLVCSILGISGLPIAGSFLGLILGYKAKHEIEESNGALEGEGLARAGIIIGWIGFSLASLGLCAFIIFMGMLFGN